MKKSSVYPFELTTFTNDGRITIPRHLMERVSWMRKRVLAKEPIPITLMVLQSERFLLAPRGDEDEKEETSKESAPESDHQIEHRLSRTTVDEDASLFVPSPYELNLDLKYSGAAYRLSVPRVFQIPLQIWKTQRKLGVVFVEGELEIWSGSRIWEFFDLGRRD